MTDENGDGKYGHRLRALQIELVKLQREWIKSETRVLVIIEGRDGAGKDGTIKRIIEHMSPRETRVFAPSKPSDRQQAEWYFQRFVPHLPSGGECVIFNRSWYNRAGVEPVMGFCTKAEAECFLDSVCEFEWLLVRSGIEMRKYYLDISKKEQKKRLEDRAKDPLKAWKTPPVDAVAIKKFDDYTKARDEMLARTSHETVPWHIVRANDKKTARLSLVANLLAGFDYPGKKIPRDDAGENIVFTWPTDAARRKLLAR